MPKAAIDLVRCVVCQECFAAKVCPPNAIVRIDPEYPPTVERDICNGCGDCVKMCPANVITINNE